MRIIRMLAAAVRAATVTDTDGTVVDTAEFFGERDEAEAEDTEDDVVEAVAEEPPGDTK